MSKQDKFRFVSLLALELQNGDIVLPSLPDVVMKIRRMLESNAAGFEQVSQAVSLDPVLVSRLFVFANSAYYSRGNAKVDSLETAIGRLGFEVVRNTAMSLAMKQLYGSNKHSEASKILRKIWAEGMKLSCMAWAVSRQVPSAKPEAAYLAGLLHDVGKLYIVTKAEEFPTILGNPQSLNEMFDEWKAQISKTIMESWGFSDEVAESADAANYLNEDPASDIRLVDVVWVAKQLLDAGISKSLDPKSMPTFIKLGIDRDALPGILGAYREKLQSMQQSLV
ncbi:MAG TPA: HDOD domain-containing protein [Woeseiaceae bacterium]|nr:HDOD domain-containing protein [Woeseiaceae bacterium]